jgi:hypothetical protein
LAIALSYGGVGICEILIAADKALEQRLSFNMSAAWPFGFCGKAKIRKFWIMKGKTRKLFC